MGYSLLIADDEIKIIQLIKELGHWEQLGIKIVAECHEGRETLNQIHALHPDIVLTDIKMPEVDGIEIIRQTMQHDPKPFFIVLSGYRYFEYARNAIQLGVEDYLLKPIDELALNEALKKVCQKIDAGRNQEQSMGQLRTYMAQEKKTALENFWQTVRNNTSLINPNFIGREVCNNSYHLCFDYDIFQCVNISISIDSLLGNQDHMLSEKIERICEYALAEHCIYYITKNYAGEYGLVLNFARDKGRIVYQGISALFYSIKDLEEIYGEFRLYIGISEKKLLIKQLGDAWREAETAAGGSLIYRDSRMIDHSQLETLSRFSVRDILTEEEELRLCNFVESLQFDQIGLIFGNIVQKALKHSNAYPGDMLEFINHLTRCIVRDEGDEEPFREEILHLKQNSYSFTQLINQYYQACDKYLHRIKTNLELRRGKVIDDAVQYIHAHYAAVLSLEEIAEQVGLSANYFSRIFKAKMGVGFVEYLTRIRMNEAKEFLVESTDSIKEIAHRVGYYDDKHFTKTFKKQVGISPKEYRKLYAG